MSEITESLVQRFAVLAVEQEGKKMKNINVKIELTVTGYHD